MDNNTSQVPAGMNQAPMQPTPAPAPMKMSNEPKKPGAGSMIATIIIIIIIVIGGLYFWGERIKLQQQNQSAMESAGTTTDMAASIQATQIQTVSQDDSVSTLQNETQATQTTGLSNGL